MRKTIIALTAVLSVLALSMTAVFAQTRPGIVTYKNAEHGFQIDHLSSWTPQPVENSWLVVRFVPSADGVRSRAAVGMPVVKTEQSNQPLKLEEVAQAMVTELQAGMADVKLTIASEATLGGEKAWRMILTGTRASDGGTAAPHRLLVIAAVHKNKPYAVGIIAPQDEWDRMRDGFDRLITSFAFIETAN